MKKILFTLGAIGLFFGGAYAQKKEDIIQKAKDLIKKGKDYAQNLVKKDEPAPAASEEEAPVDEGPAAPEAEK